MLISSQIFFFFELDRSFAFLFLVMVHVVPEHHRVKPIMAYVESVWPIIRILPVGFEEIVRSIDSFLFVVAIRVLDGRITTLLEARALTLFAVNVSIKSASWG